MAQQRIPSHLELFEYFVGIMAEVPAAIKSKQFHRSIDEQKRYEIAFFERPDSMRFMVRIGKSYVACILRPPTFPARPREMPVTMKFMDKIHRDASSKRVLVAREKVEGIDILCHLIHLRHMATEADMHFTIVNYPQASIHAVYYFFKAAHGNENVFDMKIEGDPFEWVTRFEILTQQERKALFDQIDDILVA